MRRFSFHLIAAIFTFIIGIAAAWFTGLLPKAEMLLGRVAPSYIFTPTARGCGRGYGQTYKLLGGRRMSEGSACFDSPDIAQEKLQTLIAKASEVVERAPKYKNRFGQEGERIVLIIPPNESGEGYASILWYGRGDCYLFIKAPTLDIALGFEKANAYAY